jgi:hypothetical protein
MDVAGEFIAAPQLPQFSPTSKTIAPQLEQVGIPNFLLNTL